ncbi:glycosyltransferase family 4 protein [Armatimonas sp.]|uniref:glycosyltransferase family 4 protein n=1 Tax=Armatimonas sp. TaxID=1872638 RepID=UPI00286AFD66|nr:glycosyltransferase family 4 protein [Armatimonas sp.]
MLPRVLALSSSTDNGGSQRHAVTLAAAYQAAGGSVQLACAPQSFIEHSSHTAHVPTLPFALRNSGDLRATLRLARLVRQSRAQVLHSHARRDFVTATLAGRLTGCPVALHVHVVRPLGEPHRLAGQFFNQVAAIIAVSEYTKQELERWHALKPGLVRRIYNGVEIPIFTAKTTHRPPNNGLVIGMVGRLSTKGQSAFLPVGKRLVAEFPTLRFVFVGPDASELTYAQFRQQLMMHELHNRSTLVGISDQIPDILATLDILVHLPTDEAFGLALVEAAAAGLPVVATQIGGCQEVVCEGKTGFLIPLGEDTLLQTRLHQLLEDPCLRLRLGQAGQQRVQREFCAERQRNDLCALYEEIAR